MTLGQNFQFFYRNYIDETCTFSLTSASASLVDRLYDNDRNLKLFSVGSNDTTDEVWEITLPASQNIDAFWIDNTNIKSGLIQYDAGAGYVTAQTITANAAETLFYTNQALTGVTKIKLTMSTTIVANQEKRVGEFRAIESFGEMSKNPAEFYNEWEAIEVVNVTQTGKHVTTRMDEIWTCRALFQALTSADATILESLFLSIDGFLVYPGGGAAYTDIGLRTRDMYFCKWDRAFTPNLRSQITGLGTDIEAAFREI